MKATDFILFLNTFVFLVSCFAIVDNPSATLPLCAWNPSTEFFSPFQLLTYQFIHVNFHHFAANMLFFLFCASDIETKINSNKLFFFYLLSGVIAGLSHFLVSTEPLAGASGAIWGLLLIHVFLFPDKIMKLGPIGLSVPAMLIFLFASNIYLFFIENGDRVSYIAHIFGGLTGITLILLDRYVFNKSKSSN
jgi:membrane associated rhomboid family serine protease